MRVLHFNTYTRLGGAALGTYFLHKALLANGIDSILCTRDGDSVNTKGIVPAPELGNRSILRNTSVRILNRLYPDARWAEFSHSIFCSLDLKKAIALHQPDILHFHWINDGFVNAKWLGNINTPAVVTLRDFWFLTGGCHYLDGCKRYHDGCGKCPKLGSTALWDISRVQRNVVRQLQSVPNIRFVAISSWMKRAVGNLCRSHKLRISTIPNCIPLESFYPQDKHQCRERLGFTSSEHVLFFPSLNPWSDFRKGGDLLIGALCRSIERGRSIAVLCCDDSNETIDTRLRNKVKVISLAKAENTHQMRLRYGASDFVVVPSKEEAFGKVTAEALACGRPVVAFRHTGADDIVEHYKTGYLAKNADEEDLSYGIDWAIEFLLSPDNNSESLMNFVKTRFSSEVVAREYINLYNELL
jgi:glycosyltransferase involved in cell wall biosynthesis